MKRFLFSVMALAAVVVGCSKSEVLNHKNADKMIEFNPYSGRITETRATVASEKTLKVDGFQVYAFMYPKDGNVNYTSTPFMNKIVTYREVDAEKKDSVWKYDGHAYWPASNLLDFVAYGLGAGATETDKTHINFKVAASVAEQKDLLVALSKNGMVYSDDESGLPSGQTPNYGVVDFNFSHMLSRIGFSLVTKKDNTVPVTVKQVNLVGDFYAEGNVTLTDSNSYTLKIGGEDKTVNRPFISVEGITAAATTYKLLGDNGTYTSVGSANGTAIFNNGMLYTEIGTDTPDNYNDDEFVEKKDATADDKAAAKNNENNRYMMIIPAAASVHKAHLEVIYCLPGAKTFDMVPVDLSTVDFEPGKSYDFKFKVSTNGISFDVTVEDWDVTGEDREVIKLN